MKRILALILVFSIVLSMAACSLGDFTGGTSSSKSNDGEGAKTVTVFFKVTEETGTLIGVSSLKVEKGEKLDWTTVPTAALKGCEFLGWAYDINGEKMLDIAEDRFDADTLLYAVFQRETGSGSSNLTGSTAENSGTNGNNSGDRTESTSGNSFVGSVVGSHVVSGNSSYGSGSNKDDEKVDKPTDEEMAYILYEPNGGELDVEDVVVVNKGDRYTKHPTPIREGYTFTGWYVDEECTEPVTNGKSYTEPTTILYAGWENRVYTVTFVADGVIVDEIRVLHGATYDINKSVEKDGYTFVGWKNGDYMWDSTDRIYSDLELHAVFAFREYSIRYYNVYGIENPNPTKYTAETTVELADLTRQHYSFTGWYTDEALTHRTRKISDMTGDLKLYAGWQLNHVPPTPPSDDMERWDGQTLNILATVWANGPEPSAPWAQPELTVGSDDWDSTAGFGNIINSAILRRADEIKKTYGVELNWINARGSNIATLLSEAMLSGSESARYHIAMPRAMEAQSLVICNNIYDLSRREYINLAKSYYDQASVEAYSVQDRTLFVGGDFTFVDEDASYALYYNVAMTKGLKNFPDLYRLVKEGKWTVDQMINAAKLVSKNSGDPKWTDDDFYGYGTTNLSRFYQYSGIKQVSVGETVFGIEYIITLNDSKVSTLIDKLLTIYDATWSRTDWNGGYATMNQAFTEGRLLFYDEVLQKINYFGNQTEDFKVGVLPEPKLSEAQEAYYTPVSYLSILACIPKATPDREMSDFFFEVLAYTGQKHLKTAYMENLVAHFDVECMAENIEMLEEYIFPGMLYDVGYLYGWDGLLNSVQNESYTTSRHSFVTLYENALGIANETVNEWNLSWYEYTDKINQ